MDKLELDTRIAQDVMGWELQLPQQHKMRTSSPLWWDGVNHWVQSRLPHFADYLPDAFRVVAKMREQGWFFTLEQGDGISTAGTWSAKFSRYGEQGQLEFHGHYDETPELAIGYAALRAKGIEV